MPAPIAGEVPYSSIAGPAADRAEDEVNDVISPTMMLRIGKKGKRDSPYCCYCGEDTYVCTIVNKFSNDHVDPCCRVCTVHGHRKREASNDRDADESCKD